MDAEQAPRAGKHIQLTERNAAERGRDNEHDHAERKNRLGQRSSENRSTDFGESTPTRQHRGTQSTESSTAV